MDYLIKPTKKNRKKMGSDFALPIILIQQKKESDSF